jgi:hypothetical protein
VLQSGALITLLFLRINAFEAEGWRSTSELEYVTQSCNIERRSSLTIGTFMKEFYLQKPVIITETTRNERYTWSKQELLDGYGSTIMDVGSFSSLSRTGSAVTEMTLQAYVDYMFTLNSTNFDGSTLYVFDRKQFFNNATELFRHYYRHDIFKNYPGDQTFTIGASGMGIPFHFHMDGWLEVRHQ